MNPTTNMLHDINTTTVASLDSKPAASGNDTPKTVASMDDRAFEDEMMPWEDEDWVPCTKAGKQKTPNVIRGELQRFIDASSKTQTAILEEAGIAKGSFRKFMDPKYYKHAISAYQNDTYWNGARYLARMAHEKKQNAKVEAAAKRKAAKQPAAALEAAAGGPAAKKAKTDAPKETSAQGEAWMLSVLNLENLGPEYSNNPELLEQRIYDSCPIVIKKIKKCLADHPGITKASFCRVALRGCSPATLNKFLMSKSQKGQASMAYPRAYAFFERLRIMKGEKKTKARIKNEEEKPRGFDTDIPRNSKLVFLNW